MTVSRVFAFRWMHPATAVLLLIAVAVPAAAQTTRERRFEAGAGVAWIAGMGFGERAATETAPGGNSVVLFNSDTRLGGAPALRGRIGVQLTPKLQVEAGISYRRPALTATITSDVEGIPDVEAVERLTEIIVDGALVAALRAPRAGARTVPFVTVGGGYLRHLHEGRTFVETGQSVFGGAGVNWMFEAGGAAGLRLEGRLVIHRGGAGLEERTHVAPAAGASLFLRF